MDDRIEIARDAIYDCRVKWQHDGPPTPEAMAQAVIEALDAARPAPSAVEEGEDFADALAERLAGLVVTSYDGYEFDIERGAVMIREALSAAREASAGQSAPDENASVDTVHMTKSHQRAMDHAVRKTFKMVENPNELPMEELPEGWRFKELGIDVDDQFVCRVYVPCTDYIGVGPTPRAAMLAAIAKAREAQP